MTWGASRLACQVDVTPEMVRDPHSLSHTLHAQLSLFSQNVSSLGSALPLTLAVTTQDGMEIRYPGMVDAGKLTQTPLGKALERQKEQIPPKKFTNLTKAKVRPAPTRAPLQTAHRSLDALRRDTPRIYWRVFSSSFP